MKFKALTLLAAAVCVCLFALPAQAQTQAIVNGGFETGSFSSWTPATGTLAPVVSTAKPHTGTYSALLGHTAKPEINGNASIYQTITIPAGDTATLSYWYWASTTDTISYAWQEAQIQSSTGTTLAQVTKVASNTKAWTQVTYNLSSYAGQTIRVYFNVHGNGYASDYVYMYLDDVSVTLTGGTPAFTLSESPTSLSVAQGSAGTSTITTAVSGGFNSAVALSASGQPSGVTIGFNPTSIAAPGAGSSTMTATVAPTVAAGTYPITVTGAGGGLTQNGTVNLTVTTSGGGGGSNYSLITLPDQGLTSTYAFMNSATKSLDMVMYELTDTTASGYLVALGNAGIKVRVILDQNNEKSANTPAYNQLNGATNVSVVWANPKYAVTHEKAIVVDDDQSLIMTYNLTSQYYSTSRDYGVFDNDPNDVAAIETTFNADFVYGTITPPTGDDLIWSPTNSDSSLLALINGAQSSLLVENEEMSATDIVSALGAAAKRGVACTIVMTYQSTYKSELTTLKGDGCKIATYAETASLYIHAKAVLADYGQSTAKLYLGSENFSTASLTKNRELGLIWANASIMTSVDTTITSDYNGGTPY
jgi:hypothetical protein